MGIFSSQKKQGRQLINFDGSPYATRFLPAGFREAAQFVTSPPVLMGLAAAFSLAAYEVFSKGSGGAAALAPEFLRQAKWPAIVGVLHELVSYQNARAKSGGNAAIDKSGQNASGQEYALDAANKFHYVGCSYGMVTLLCAVSGRADPLALATDSFVWTFALQAGWNLYAGYKIEKGDWTIQGDPPGKPSKERKFSLGRFMKPAR